MVNWKTWLIRGAIFTIGGTFVAGALTFGYAYFTVKIPDPKAFVSSQSTIIQYADSSELGRIGSENRTIVKLANIPLNLRHAILAAEDKGFYSESAFSPTGILRAIYHNISGGTLQGGSTITQQYAKTAFLTQSRTVTRKIKELVIATKLESQQSKDQIFESYLNTIYFGRGSYGVSTAAQVYFNRTVTQLSIGQDAVIAAILNSPGYYDPQSVAGLARLKRRFSYVLTEMQKAHWITKSQAVKEKFPFIEPRTLGGTLGGPKGYVVSWVEHELLSLGFTDQQIQVGGLVVKTTIDKRAQQAAVDAVAKRTPASAPANLRIALIAIRPGTGEITALYGGQDYLKQQLNNATQATAQAGSSFKPFALVAALEQGISLQSMWNGSSPAVFYDAGAQKNYSVFNYGGEQFPQVSLANATAHSVNTVFVPLGIKVGPDKVIDVARRAGIPTSVNMIATPSVTLGVASPHVIDVASAYATFAAQGVYAKPFIVKEVLGANQGVLYESRIQANQVFAADVMADTTAALQGVTQFGTASGALAGFGRPSAGKTGTTTDNASAWFNGYTPQLEATVAMFRDDATQSLNGIGGLNAVTGGSYPASIWSLFMKAALAKQPIVDFPAPSDIGGTTPVDMTQAVPTLDPALAEKPTPVASAFKPSPKPKSTKKK